MKCFPLRSFFQTAVCCWLISCDLLGVTAAAAQKPGNDDGLTKHVVQISMSHSIGWLRQKDAAQLQTPLTDEVYRQAVKRFGEAAAEEVTVRVYLPQPARPVSGLLLISEHGVGGPMMEHPLVRQFANRRGVALVGVLGNPIQRGIYPASTLDGILQEIGQKLNHPEFATAPAFTFGHSNGTGFSALYAAMRPDRVVGWVSYQSGGSWHLLFPGVENVPGLAMHAHSDKFFQNGQEQAIADLRTKRNAPISLLIDGKSGHWPSDREATFALVLDFYEACIRIRCPGGVLSPDTPLKPVTIENGWLAQRYDCAQGGMQELKIFPYDKFSSDRSAANWLPDQAFAKSWQRYAATGKPGKTPSQ